ncbi:hypothetical protein ACH5RR_027241 [Cinchona calisaya]|uniref:Uncharacterized protein n=1 Tax=Cinchona calisaya TaxID=153742 RepID=A0ABD2Z6Q9_9GENT
MQRLNGSLLSELSIEKDPRNSQERTSTLLESHKTESQSTQWTDQKHSLYLDSMEASFVNQLYDSLDVLGGCSKQECTSEPKSSRQMNNGVPTPSGQFKVFKDGSWVRVNFSNFSRELPRPRKAEKSVPFLANPWIQHYRSSSRHRTTISPTSQGQALVFRCQDSIGSNAEVTDQNFVDEVFEEENTSRKRHQKCRKVSATTASSNDQVVPLAKLSLDIAADHGSQKQEELGVE